MNPPLLSVGVPVYNGGQYLAAALDSALGQDYDNVEIVIADNCSSDDTAEIGRRYARTDVRVRYLRNAEHIGPSSNFARSSRKPEASTSPGWPTTTY